jgi:hypothetical protein
LASETTHDKILQDSLHPDDKKKWDQQNPCGFVIKKTDVRLQRETHELIRIHWVSSARPEEAPLCSLPLDRRPIHILRIRDSGMPIGFGHKRLALGESGRYRRFYFYFIELSDRY